MNDPLYPVNESTYALCPELYSKLHSQFSGGVIIANQGEGFLQSSPMVNGRFYTSVHQAGEYYRVNCPFCNDTKHRLWVNHMYGQPDANGRPMRFLATCYNDNCLGETEQWTRFNDAIFGLRNRHDRQQPVFALRNAPWMDASSVNVAAEPPGEVIPVSQLALSMPNHPAVDYMCGRRRYTTHMLDHYQVGYVQRALPKYRAAQDRIVFPIYYEQNLVGWQARYIGTADWHHTPKYYGMPGMKKRFMLYNFDNAKDKDMVVVVEGPTDVHVIGDSCIAILGKNMSQYQVRLLVGTWGEKPIVMILDPDAREEMRGTVADLRNSGCIVVEITLPEGFDPGDYDRPTLWNIIHSQSRERGVILPAA